MKITYSDEGAYSRIWLTGPFWQLAMARRIADAGLYASPVNTWESRGITFQITLYGKSAYVLRAYKAMAKAMARAGKRAVTLSNASATAGKSFASAGTAAPYWLTTKYYAISSVSISAWEKQHDSSILGICSPAADSGHRRSEWCDERATGSFCRERATYRYGAQPWPEEGV
ncbi:hypothetical protein TUM17574_47440 [Klebsiella pneumoniae]|nr:hypothetical protein TUM16656_45410 [Klebsiella pneumoniae]GJK26619.1 hypothetical protein TUM17555_42940 [Klebsiella pneumoniae]GJK79267.1 hypothetical protein TUM17566_13190 [Klebsiella pneumoniae]GJL26368.1 hypothetical protein TUM17574_47440 [Klebsiella pneumoniae]